MRISDWSSDVCSSDLAAGAVAAVDEGMADLLPGGKADVVAGLHHMALVSKQQRHLAFEDEGMLLLQQVIVPGCAAHAGRRSEEHTSELQSLMRISYAVFCLKKKKNYTKHQYNNILNDETKQEQ